MWFLHEITVTFLQISRKFLSSISQQSTFLKSALNNDSVDKLSIQKYCQLFTWVEYVSLTNTPNNPIQTNNEKNSQNLPSPWGIWTHLRHQCVGWPYSPHMAARSQLCNTVTTGYNGMPHIHPKLPLAMGRSPSPCTCLILGSSRPTTPYGIQIELAFFLQYTGQTEWQTHRHTDRQLATSPVPIPAYTIDCSDVANNIKMISNVP